MIMTIYHQFLFLKKEGGKSAINNMKKTIFFTQAQHPHFSAGIPYERPPEEGKKT